MITVDALEPVRRIEMGSGVGSCFLLARAGRQYIISAGHLAAKPQAIRSVNLWLFDRWHEVPVTLIHVGDLRYPEQDTIVFAAAEQIGPFSLDASRGGFYISQDVYFAGYPYNNMTDGLFAHNLSYPFLKKAIISGVLQASVKPGLIILDGHNNPGFSGGPVLAVEPGRTDSKAIGIISGYRTDILPVDGSTDLHVETNAGMIYVAPMKPVLDAIDSNPAGHPLDPHWDWNQSRFVC